MTIKAILAEKKRRCLSLWSDKRGNFAILTAIAAFPVMFTIGGVVDLNMFYTNRVKIQNAADAAALAAAKRYPFDPDEGRLEQFAQDYYDANVGGDLYRTASTLDYEGTEINENGVRELTISVEFAYSPIFLPLMIGDFTGMDGKTHIESVIAIGNTTVEMAMVLDTSGSMLEVPDGGGGQKIVALREVAEKAINQLFAASEMAGVDKPVQISLVPFSGAVNVGPQNLNASWMDTKGLSKLHNAHLDWTTYNYSTGTENQIARQSGAGWVRKDNATPLTRQYLYANMRPHKADPEWSWDLCPTYMTSVMTSSAKCNWDVRTAGQFKMRVTGVSGHAVYKDCLQTSEPRCHPPYKLINNGDPYFAFPGCVETRPDLLGMTDTLPNQANPDTLFVPWFAPDEYDTPLNLSYGNNFLNDRGWEQTSYADYDRGYYYNGENVGWRSPVGTYALREHRNKTTNVATTASQKNVGKYLMMPTKALGRTRPGTNRTGSPSYLCESDAILPLTTKRQEAVDAVKRLAASGSTNVEEGLGWGWRTLSPIEPFTGGRPKDDENNYKAIVLMTDGANTYYANDTINKSGYGSFGYASEGRIYQGTTVTKSYTNASFNLAMNQRTAQLCENAKNDGRVPVTTARGDPIMNGPNNPRTRDGIVIYTIAFDIPDIDKPRVKTLLQDCASYSVTLQRQGLTTDPERKLYYEANTNKDLETIFDEIIASLSSLRIAR